MDNPHIKLFPENAVYSRAPHTLIVDLSIRYGGASTRAISLAQSLSPWGSIIAGIENSPVVQLAREKQIRVSILGKTRTDPLIPFRLAKTIREEEIQVVDTQNIQSKFWTSFGVLLVDVAFVSTLNSSYKQEHGNSWKSRLYHAIDLLTNGSVDRFIAVSETVRKGLMEDGVPPESIELIRSAVDVGAYPDPMSIDASQIRERIGIPRNAILCSMVGRLVWAKGFDDFILAFSRVVKQVKNAKAVIIGDGELRLSLQRQIEELGLHDSVFLLGYLERSALLNILLASDLYVMSSRSEGIPYALLEAAALGLPIVSTNCGGIPEVVTNEESALLVPVGDVSALCNAIVTLCKDGNLAKGMGEKARKRIVLDYSLSVQIEMTKKAYLRAVSGRKNSP